MERAHAFGVGRSDKGFTAANFYLDAANRAVDFFFTKMFRDGFLLHTYKDGQAKLLGYLDDYAFFASGLLYFYEASFDRQLLDRAVQLADIMMAEFWDESDGGFFYTGKSHEPLISRAKPLFDASIPSGNVPWRLVSCCGFMR